jgi:hypothetical protein
VSNCQHFLVSTPSPLSNSRRTGSGRQRLDPVAAQGSTPFPHELDRRQQMGNGESLVDRRNGLTALINFGSR